MLNVKQEGQQEEQQKCNARRIKHTTALVDPTKLFFRRFFSPALS